MIRNSRVVVLCHVLFVLLTVSSAAQDPQVPCADLVANIRVDSLLQPVIASLLRKSKIFRHQWLTIASSRRVRVTIKPLTPGLLGYGTRAHATLTRYEYGLVRAEIEMPIGSDYAELLPHEFEHVLEMIEGINLAQQAESSDGGIAEVDKGTFETRRARDAGLAASREVHGHTDATISRVWRAISSRAVPDHSRRGGPASRW